MMRLIKGGKPEKDRKRYLYADGLYGISPSAYELWRGNTGSAESSPLTYAVLWRGWRKLIGLPPLDVMKGGKQ